MALVKVKGIILYSLNTQHSTLKKITSLIVYIDDIIVTCDNVEQIKTMKDLLAKELTIKDLGNLRDFLSIKVARSKHGIAISQRKYVLDLLKEAWTIGCKPANTPIDPNHKLGSGLDESLVDKEKYKRLVGKLIYLSHTRPNIAYAVSVVS